MYLLATLGPCCRVQAFSSCRELELLSSCGVRASLVRSTGSGALGSCRSRALEHSLSSWVPRA